MGKAVVGRNNNLDSEKKMNDELWRECSNERKRGKGNRRYFVTGSPFSLVLSCPFFFFSRRF